MKPLSTGKASVLGYLLIVTTLYSILFVFNVISIQYFGKPPIGPVQETAGWISSVIWYLLIAASVLVGHYYGRVSYWGVAVCIFVFTVAIPQMLASHMLRQLIPVANRSTAEISIATPWYSLMLPSLVAVLVLFVYKYITNTSKPKAQQ